MTEGKLPTYPFSQITTLPRDYTLPDISYIIGGYFWKAIFVDAQGYIVTDAPAASENLNYLNQFNFANPSIGTGASWSSFHPGQAEFALTCGTCHSTGYNANGNQDDLPGITGTWTQPGVRCERCHGPGSLHTNNPQGVRMLVERDSALCRQCHTYVPVTSLDIKNGFIQHGDQYGDLSQSKHQILDCLTCHDPHTGVVQLQQTSQQTTRLMCQDCHFKEAQFQNNPAHVTNGIGCPDCHMPKLIQSASANSRGFTADLPTHVVAIDPRLVSQFDADGNLISGQISLDYACRRCHGQTKSSEQLLAAASNYHAIPTALPAP